MPKEKKTIILIDDDKWLTDLYGLKLQQEGFNILCAASGVEGSKLTELYKPDLILLDLVMPNGDGFYFLKKIKQNELTKNKIPCCMAYKKIKLGSSLVQLITGMIFEGPQVISEINLGLVRLLERDGFENISQAIGSSYGQN